MYCNYISFKIMKNFPLILLLINIKLLELLNICFSYENFGHYDVGTSQTINALKTNVSEIPKGFRSWKIQIQHQVNWAGSIGIACEDNQDWEISLDLKKWGMMAAFWHVVPEKVSNGKDYQFICELRTKSRSNWWGIDIDDDCTIFWSPDKPDIIHYQLEEETIYKISPPLTPNKNWTNCECTWVKD